MLLAKGLFTFNHVGNGVLAIVSYRDVGLERLTIDIQKQ